MIQELAVNLEYSEKQNDIFFPESSYPKFTIVPKGRRAGLTNGAAHAFIEYGLSGDNDYWFLPKGDLYFLWGDTISTNIDKYIERYFLPVIKTLPESLFTWKKQEKLVKIGRATIDFRSADRPENWEGFGYHFIFLNEAGIILENDYLYDNAVLPMLMDYEFSRLIAAGVPKGKRTKFGIHKFHTLYEKAKNGDKDYRLIQLTGYDNPFIHQESIDLVASTLDDATKRQEIDGEFIDVNEQAYLYAFKESKHVISEYTPNPHLPILISFDFNKEPMTATVSQKIDLHNTVTFDELQIHDGSTPEMCEMILAKYIKWLYNMDVTGDATGRNRSAMTRGNLNHYRIIKDMLQLKDRNLLVPKSNMAHKDSRVLCNSVLQNSKFKITKNCTTLIRDFIYASVDEKGELIKTQAEGRHCFSGETLITTKEGLKRIDKILKGDLVLTRSGYKPVLEHFNNGQHKVCRIVLSLCNDTQIEIVCTPDHKILTDKGWLEISKLLPGMMVSFHNGSMVESTKSIMEKSTFDRLKKEPQECMLTYGHTTMAIDHREDFTFTILTVISTIIDLKISNLLRQVSTSGNTCLVYLNQTLSTFKKWLKGLKMLLLSGAKHRKGRSSEKSMLRMCFQNIMTSSMKRTPSNSVNFADQNIKQINYANRLQDSAQTTVKAHNVGKMEQTLNPGFAKTVEKSSWSISTEKIKTVVVHAEFGTRTVYDLHVQDQHEYFANGVLVHNCFDNGRYTIHTCYPDFIKRPEIYR